jgi:hypothetical protein
VRTAESATSAAVAASPKASGRSHQRQRALSGWASSSRIAFRSRSRDAGDGEGPSSSSSFPAEPPGPKPFLVRQTARAQLVELGQLERKAGDGQPEGLLSLVPEEDALRVHLPSGQGRDGRRIRERARGTSPRPLTVEAEVPGDLEEPGAEVGHASRSVAVAKEGEERC